MSHIRMVRIFAVVVALSTISDQCFAQPQQGGRQRGGQGGRQRGGSFGSGFGSSRGGTSMDKIRLLGVKDVQEELALNEEQVVSVKETLDGYREEAREIGGPRFDFRGLRDLSEDERAAKMKEFEKSRAETEKKRDKIKKSTVLLIEASLEPDQVKRLGQIELQQKGIKALIEEAIIAQLNLSDEQVTKIKDILKSQDEKTAKIRSEAFGGFRGGRGRGGDAGGRGRPQRPTGDDDQALVPATGLRTYTTALVPQQDGGRQRGGGDREEMMKRFEEMRKKTAEVTKETETLVMAVLTDAQKKQFEEMKGEKFELDIRAAFARGRGGDQQGRGRGGQGRGRGGANGSDRPQRPGADDN
jgi:hypothetical protein